MSGNANAFGATLHAWEARGNEISSQPHRRARRRVLGTRARHLLGCPLSPLIGAFFRDERDRRMSATGLFCIRFMDDVLVLAPIRWKLRRAVGLVNAILGALRLEKHPAKTFIGRIARAPTSSATAAPPTPHDHAGHQRQETLARRDAGELLSEIARSYNVSSSTISRLTTS